MAVGILGSPTVTWCGWGARRDCKRSQRVVLWSIFERVRSALKARGLVTYSDVFSRVALKLTRNRASAVRIRGGG